MSMFNDGAAEDWELGDAIRIPVDLDGPTGEDGPNGAGADDPDGQGDSDGD